MKCQNISKDTNEHSLYINPNGLCNKCMMVKDRNIERRRKNVKD
jgi:hypothetical protein